MAELPSAVVAERLRAQLLAGGPAPTVTATVERILAVQAQDLRAAQLALRARSRRLTLAAVERAFAERSLVVSWLNRGTLHLVRRDDYWWLHALTAPRFLKANARRLKEEGVRDPERAVVAVAKDLDDGPLTRGALVERTKLKGQALVHLLMLAR